MTLNLGIIDDPLNQMIKSPTWPEGLSLSGNLKDDCDIVDPVIEIETTSNISNINYAYIPDFGRYYFAHVENIGAKFWRITMHCDVLHTFATQIKACDCIVAMNENRFNMYLPDSNYKAYQNNKILINRFPGGFNLNNARFILTAFCETSASGPITANAAPAETM